MPAFVLSVRAKVYGGQRGKAGLGGEASDLVSAALPDASPVHFYFNFDFCWTSIAQIRPRLHGVNMTGTALRAIPLCWPWRGSWATIQLNISTGSASSAVFKKRIPPTYSFVHGVNRQQLLSKSFPTHCNFINKNVTIINF